MASRITRPSLCKFLAYLQRVEPAPPGNKILDCGAGGKFPPLALFYEHGYHCFGIDISDEQIQYALEFSKESEIELNILKADMRNIPFEDEYFDSVYECESMCHLIKSDIRLAISEIWRTLKPGGYGFLTFMLLDSVPLMGKDSGDGEFTSRYGGEEFVHSYFADREPELYLSDFEIVGKEKRTVLYHDHWTDLSLDDWMAWHRDDWTHYSREDWAQMYGKRLSHPRTSFLEYILKKPS